MWINFAVPTDFPPIKKKLPTWPDLPPTYIVPQRTTPPQAPYRASTQAPSPTEATTRKGQRNCSGPRQPRKTGASQLNHHWRRTNSSFRRGYYSNSPRESGRSLRSRRCCCCSSPRRRMCTAYPAVDGGESRGWTRPPCVCEFAWLKNIKSCSPTSILWRASAPSWLVPGSSPCNWSHY